jgi:polar amino acid transport system substrate-binding protein
VAITFNVCLTTFTIIDIYGPADLLDDIKQKRNSDCHRSALCPFEMLEDGKIVGLGKDILTEVMKGLPG